jgi:hypothetical protein
MWFWHNTNEGITFKVKGLFKVILGPTNASLDMTRDVGIAFEVICNFFAILAWFPIHNFLKCRFYIFDN